MEAPLTTIIMITLTIILIGLISGASYYIIYENSQKAQIESMYEYSYVENGVLVANVNYIPERVRVTKDSGQVISQVMGCKDQIPCVKGGVTILENNGDFAMYQVRILNYNVNDYVIFTFNGIDNSINPNRNLLVT